VKVVKIYIYLS